LFGTAFGATPKDATTAQCLGENGEPVDWWIILKGHYGWDYIYIDSTTRGKFSELQRDLNDKTKGALSLTMQAIQQGAHDDLHAYFAYSDAPPKKRSNWSMQTIETSDSKVTAHAKGVVAFDKKNALWLVHSVPHFPQRHGTGGRYAGLPKSSLLYGQSFLCMTLRSSALDTIADLLITDNANIYLQKIPNQFSAQLRLPLRTARLANSANHLVASFKTPTQKTKITAFAKGPSWGLDLFHHLIAPHFGVGLSVRTWMHSELNIPSVQAGQHCNTTYFEQRFSPTTENTCPIVCKRGDEPTCVFHQNIWQVDAFSLGNNVSLSHEHDHSKWAVSEPSAARPIVCIGDINTQKSQRLRGGGAACLEDNELWRAFRQKIIRERQP
jgi:hypothetical protein